MYPKVETEDSEAYTRYLLGCMIEFSNLGPDRGVNNVVLEGLIRSERVLLKEFVGLFPDRGIVAFGSEGFVSIYRTIVGLTIPERVRALQMPDIADVRMKFETVARISEYPIMLVTLGTYEKSCDPVIVLYIVAGISPETALDELQARARERLASVQ